MQFWMLGRRNVPERRLLYGDLLIRSVNGRGS